MLSKPRIPFLHLLLYGWMPSPLKALAYRLLRGYRIGRHVKFGPFGIVVGEQVDLGDHVEIGMLAIVMGKKITIGRHSSVGTMSYVSCRTIEIGEDAKIREQVFVGGPQLPESRFALGSRTIVLQMAYINPTKPVVIGDDTGIGGHCLIFTHGAWLNALDGYPVNYEPVTLGKSVWLPWRVFVMPGTTIGDGSVIGANSLVQGTIPPSSLAVGSPAKVIRSAPDFPKKLTDEQRAAKVAEIMIEFDRYMEAEGVTITTEGSLRVYRRGRRRWGLLWKGADDRNRGAQPPGEVAVAGGGWTLLSEKPLTEANRQQLSRQGVFWLDLGGKSRSEGGSPLTEELATFIARYGIRLPRDR